MSRTLLANLAAAAASLSAGACVVATRMIVEQTGPETLVFWRYAIGVLCFLPLLPFIRPAAAIPWGDLLQIAGLGILFFGFFPWAFSAALQFTTAPRGAIGLATIPIQTLVVAALFGLERLSRNKLASVALAFAGVAVVFGPAALAGAGAEHLPGDGLMLLGAFSAALYSVLGRALLGRHGPVFVTALSMMAGVAAMAPLALLDGGAALPDYETSGWLALAFLGTMGGMVQFSLFAWALRWLPPSRTVIYLTLNPISAMLLAALLLGEAVTPVLLLGLALVLAGIAVANLPAARLSPRPAAPAAPRR